jgi:acyl CoA:acetate/3-ketoacid CoA transferase beta subunit
MSSTFFFKGTGGANPLIAIKKKSAVTNEQKEKGGKEDQEFNLSYKKGEKIRKIT